MPSFNRVILVGRLTRDPELRYTAGGLAVTTFSLAVDRRFKNQQTGERQTDFFRCKAWRQKAEFVANYIGKGRLVCVEGSIEINEVPGQDGQKRFFTDIICDNVESLDAPRDGAGDGEFGGAGAGPAVAEDHGDYYPEEPAAPPAPVNQAATRPAPRASAPAGGGGGGARAAAPAGGRATAGAAAGGGGASSGGGRAATAARQPQPQPAYPADDDYDDSDPFADE